MKQTARATSYRVSARLPSIWSPGRRVNLTVRAFKTEAQVHTHAHRLIPTFPPSTLLISCARLRRSSRK